jgi:hypothetical protein
MRQTFQPRQSKKTTCAFDRMHKAENVIEDLSVVWVLLKLHKLNVNNVKAFIGLGQKL